MRCTRRLEFDAGHRVLGHESKCASWHGHRYVVEITAEAAPDSIGRVIDFGVIKALVGTWIDRHWDHAMLLFEEDEELLALSRKLGPEHRTFVLPLNPTAENLAAYLRDVVCPQVFKSAPRGLRIVKVVVRETPNCWAEALCIE